MNDPDSGRPLALLAPPGTRVYLASRSPRRRELLLQIGVDFEVISLREGRERDADVDETPFPGEQPLDYVLRIAVTKADVAWQRLTERRAPGLPLLPVLAADTTVTLDGAILGKPADRSEARRMLRALAGREHRVLTAVAVRMGERLETGISDSRVRMADLAQTDIDAYVESDDPLDKAGAYGIQGQAAAFIEDIRGSYSGIMGLPVHETAVLLARIRNA